MTCAICGLAVGAGAYRDAQDRPVHHYCRALRSLTQAAARAVLATATPPLVRRQSARRVRKW